MLARPELGRWGESQAAEHLKRAGYRIVERNVRSRFGEIDIVARDGSCLVIVEVRTRQSPDPSAALRAGFPPEESINRAKQRRLAALGAWYVKAHGLVAADWRADVIAVERGPGGEVQRLEHYVNAVEAPE